MFDPDYMNTMLNAVRYRLDMKLSRFKAAMAICEKLFSEFPAELYPELSIDGDESIIARWTFPNPNLCYVSYNGFAFTCLRLGYEPSDEFDESIKGFNPVDAAKHSRALLNEFRRASSYVEPVHYSKVMNG